MSHHGFQAQRHWLTWAPLSLPHQLAKNIKQTDAVKPLRLPRGKDLLSPGQKCTVAGWGWVTWWGPISPTLQEVELTLQGDWKCEGRFEDYNRTIQLCVGNPEEKKSSFKVILNICLAWLWEEGCLGKDWDLRKGGNPSPSRLGYDLSPREEKRGDARAERNRPSERLQGLWSLSTWCSCRQ